MTQDEIIEITRQAGGFDATPEFLAKFANLVAQNEREACAKIVEANADACSTDSLAKMYLYSNATAIRARGQA